MNFTSIVKALNSQLGYNYNGVKLTTIDFAQDFCDEEDDTIELTLKVQATGELRKVTLILSEDEILAVNRDGSQVFCHGSSTANRLVAQILNTLTRE